MKQVKPETWYLLGIHGNILSFTRIVFNCLLAWRLRLSTIILCSLTMITNISHIIQSFQMSLHIYLDQSWRSYSAFHMYAELRLQKFCSFGCIYSLHHSSIYIIFIYLNDTLPLVSSFSYLDSPSTCILRPQRMDSYLVPCSTLQSKGNLWNSWRTDVSCLSNSRISQGSQRTLQPHCRFCWPRTKSNSKSYRYKAHQKSSKSTTLFVPQWDSGGIAPAPQCLCFCSNLAKDPALLSFFSKSCLCPCTWAS